MPVPAVPALRVRRANDAPVRHDGTFILYWMTMARRVGWNFALDRALEWVRELGRPLVILEALRVGYPWASERLHRFILDGMADTARRLRGTGVIYYPYVEPAPNVGKGLLRALGHHAAVCVTDEFPAFMLPRMLAAAARQIPVRLEAVDSNGLLPLGATGAAFPTAHGFRRFLQQRLPRHLGESPAADPLARRRLPTLAGLPPEVSTRWPPASAALLDGHPVALAALPIDHAVGATTIGGGLTDARRVLTRFLTQRLPRYLEDRNHPDAKGASGLSPYLHFGHISTHEIFARLAAQERWAPVALVARATGRRSGWWGMSASAEAFLDQLVTWRELGYAFCAHRQDYDRYDSLPAWALATLAKHARDPRPHRYTLEALDAGQTHDPLWNAAQTQLVREGWLHNYLRMLWGKKILEWSPHPRDALAVMIQLMNRYALDGRDPNSYTGYFWVLGRHDHPWGPERPIFGTVRYMSSENTARKVRVREYLRRYAP